MLVADHVFAAFEPGIADPGDIEVLGEQPCGAFQNRRRVTQVAKRIVQGEKKRQPFFVGAQLRFRSVMLERRPDSIRHLFGKRDLLGRPHTWRAAMDAECADEAAVLDQQRSNIRADTRRLQRCSLLDGVRLDQRVADRQRAAFQNFLGAAGTEVDPGKAGRLWG